MKIVTGLLAAAMVHVLIASLPTLLAAEPPASMHFDRAWWEGTSSAEQQSFIAGYLDCRHHPTRDQAVLGQFEGLIDSRKGDGANFVPSAIEAGVHRLRPRSRADIRQADEEALNGEYWGNVNPGSHVLEVRRGFVEGFLACKDKQVTPGLVAADVEQLDRYYAGELHHGDRIHDVLSVIERQQTR